MDQINQVPTVQPVQTPAQPAKESTPFAQTQTPAPSSTPSPTPLSQLPSFAPKKSNVKLWAGVIGGILIVVIGAAMILGKTKTYKGSLVIMPPKGMEKEKVLPLIMPQEIIEGLPAEKLPELKLPTEETQEQERGVAEEIKGPSAASDEMLADVEKAKQAAEQEGPLLAYGEVQKGILEDNKLQEIGSLIKTINGLADQAGQVFGAMPKASSVEAMLGMAEKINGFLTEAKNALSSAQDLKNTLTIDENKNKAAPFITTGQNAVTIIENFADKAGPMAKEEANQKQIAEEQLKNACESTPGARWNEDGDNSGCVFGGTEHPSAASPEQLAMISKTEEEPRSGQKPLSAASDKSLSVKEHAVKDTELLLSLCRQYGKIIDNTGCRYNGAIYTSSAELQRAINEAKLAASKASDAKNAAQKAADAEDAKKQVVLTEPEPEPEPKSDLDEIAKLKAEIADLKNQLNSAANDNNDTLMNSLLDEISYLNSKISSLGGQPVNVTVNVPEYKYPSAPDSACADPSFVYDPFKKKCVAPTEVGASGGGSGGGGGGTKKSVASAEGKKGAMEMPEMWGDEVKTSTIETSEMWGDVTPTAAPKTGAAAAGTGYGATIQGKTGPGILLYPIFIAGANSLYYILRKRRKN